MIQAPVRRAQSSSARRRAARHRHAERILMRRRDVDGAHSRPRAASAATSIPSSSTGTGTMRAPARGQRVARAGIARLLDRRRCCRGRGARGAQIWSAICEPDTISTSLRLASHRARRAQIVGHGARAAAAGRPDRRRPSARRVSCLACFATSATRAAAENGRAPEGSRGTGRARGGRGGGAARGSSAMQRPGRTAPVAALASSSGIESFTNVPEPARPSM